MAKINAVADKIVYQTLRDLNANFTDMGFCYTIVAMRLAWEDEENLYPVNRKIYGVIASQAGCNPTAVESAIRELSRKTWGYHKQFFLKYEESLLTAPSNKVFLEILLRDLEKKAEEQGTGHTGRN